MDTQQLRVYNLTRKCYVSLRAAPANSATAPLEELLAQICEETDRGVWLKPFQAQGLPPETPLFDLLYLDQNNQVIEDPRSSPAYIGELLIARIASVLVLPGSSIQLSETRAGDQLVIGAPAEMKRYLGLFSRPPSFSLKIEMLQSFVEPLTANPSFNPVFATEPVLEASPAAPPEPPPPSQKTKATTSTTPSAHPKLRTYRQWLDAQLASADESAAHAVEEKPHELAPAAPTRPAKTQQKSAWHAKEPKPPAPQKVPGVALLARVRGVRNAVVHVCFRLPISFCTSCISFAWSIPRRAFRALRSFAARAWRSAVALIRAPFNLIGRISFTRKPSWLWSKATRPVPSVASAFAARKAVAAREPSLPATAPQLQVKKAAAAATRGSRSGYLPLISISDYATLAISGLRMFWHGFVQNLKQSARSMRTMWHGTVRQALADTPARKLPAPARSAKPAVPARVRYSMRMQPVNEPRDRRRSWRRKRPDLTVFFSNGGAPQSYIVGDVSATGFYMLTPERWMPGTMLRLTLQKKGTSGKFAGDYIIVWWKVVRSDMAGVGGEFILSGPDTHARYGDLPGGVMHRVDLEHFLVLSHIPAGSPRALTAVRQ